MDLALNNLWYAIKQRNQTKVENHEKYKKTIICY